jgi:hypothetical protein
MRRDPPPLDEDLRAAFERGRTLLAPPADAKSRVLARVEGLAAAGRLDPASTGSERFRSGSSLAGRLATFALGVATGVGGSRLTAHPPHPDASAQEPAAPPGEVASPKPVGDVQRSAARAGGTTAPGASAPASFDSTSRPPGHAVSTSARATAADDPFVTERSLLDRARTALERDDPTRALRLAEEHERRFPEGLLGQEREAIAISALVVLGRNADARARAADFRRRFPDSILRRSIEAALAGVDAAP